MLAPNNTYPSFHFPPGKALSLVSSPSSLPHGDCFNDLERKMYNNTRRVCNEVRKMYKEIKVMQMPPG